MAERNRLYEKHYKTLIASSEERGRSTAHPLAALVAVLEEDFRLSERSNPEQASDFLREIHRPRARNRSHRGTTVEVREVT